MNHFITSDDVERSARFYTEVLGGTVVFGPVPTVVELSNSFIVINTEARPTTSRRSPSRRRAIPTGPAASSISGSKTSRPRTPPGARGAPSSYAAETAPVRDPLLHPRSRRLPDRSGPDHGPEGGLDSGPGPRVNDVVMTTAIIGAGGIGSAIAREFAAGGETLRLASADHDRPDAGGQDRPRCSRRRRQPRRAARRRRRHPSAALHRLKTVIDEIADQLAGQLVVVPSNPITADAHGNISHLLPRGQSSGRS